MIAHLLVPIVVTIVHFRGGDHVGFSVALPFMSCFGSTSTIYPLMIEKVELTASHALLRPLVFYFPVTTTHGVPILGEDGTWSFTSIRVPISGEGCTWSLTTIGVLVPSDDRTWLLTPADVLVSSADLKWSLTSIRVPIPGEHHTSSLTFTRVPISGDDCSWLLTHSSTSVFSFYSPLCHALEKVVVKGRIM